jgi:hypothetical protein
MDNLKIPAVGEYVEHVGIFIRSETIEPPPPPDPEIDYIFEEVEARCELRLGDEVIDKIKTLNDWYGLETSVKTTIEDMKEYAEKRKLSSKSELEVVVIKVVRQYRARPVKIDRISYCPDFESLEYYKATRGLPEPTETIVWSSKKTK